MAGVPLLLEISEGLKEAIPYYPKTVSDVYLKTKQGIRAHFPPAGYIYNYWT